ncbi:sensor domain-containing diguanylate cyclase [Anaerosporobacter faecicola]|uniref:sensor domain-containing diguanylate cyclase n=1 Tax=Anaerosporobacter faecicola TaxID=2718714 RepID=UPI00143C9399|nr:diguanylate cyclase [Anaerosporobacter faecicola]
MKNKNFKYGMRLGLIIMSVVFCLVIVYTLLASTSIIKLSKENLTIKSNHCANQLNDWTGEIISELEIYKKVIEDNFTSDKELQQFLSSTYQVHDAYPMGIYVGDETGFYVDASGWTPESDWNIQERPWYIAGKDSEDFVFCEPYYDAQLGIICTSVSAKIHLDHAIRVLSVDVYVDFAEKLISEITNVNDVDGALFVAGKDRIILADSGKHMGGDNLSECDERFYQQLNAIIEANKLGQSTIRTEDGVYYVDITQMAITNWYLISFIKRSTLLAPMWRLGILMALIGIFSVLVLIHVTRNMAMSMAEMTRKAKTDNLTTLLNREGFEEQVMKLLKITPNQGILLICDMDNFKAINDTYGHPIGDKTLKKYAALLKNYFNRREDVVARMGGDEFAVFVGHEISNENIEEMMKKFMELIGQQFEKDYPGMKISTSIGGTFVRDEQDFQKLYRLADSALYTVKGQGKNNYCIVS